MDDLGRPLTVTDPVSAVTTMAYTPAVGPLQTNVVAAGGFVTSASTTNALGHVSSTALEIERQLPTSLADANGQVTSIGYDGLGRTIRVTRPGDTTGPPTMQFVYDIHPYKLAAPEIETIQRTSGSSTTSSFAYLDGLGRARQTQTSAPGGGRILTTVGYDARGLARWQTDTYSAAGAAGSGIDTSTTAPHLTTVDFDNLERPTASTYWAGAGAPGNEQWTTVTNYGGDTVTITPPSGGATRTQSDVYGRTINVDEYLGSATGSPYARTTNVFDDADRLLRVDQPVANDVVYAYDLGGRMTDVNDPDLGAWHYTYDAKGNPTVRTDGRGTTTNTAYDALGRPTAQRTGALAGSGTMLSGWTYDNVASGSFGRGLPYQSQTYVSGNVTFTQQATVYDNRGRLTTTDYIVPDGPDAGGDPDDYRFAQMKRPGSGDCSFS